MLSICSCTINSKFETENWLDALYYHNPDTKFEVCLVVDTRVDDGALEYLQNLQKKYKNLKLIENSKEDAIEYMEKLIQFYRSHKSFPKEFCDHLESNLDQYKAETLYNPSKAFLWLPSGWLYNKAAKHATGDILVFGPADYIYMFKLSELETFANVKTKGGIYYGKPNGLFRTVSNSSTEEINAFLADHGGKVSESQSQALRNYLNFPSTVDQLAIVDEHTNSSIQLTDPKYFQKCTSICRTVPDLRLRHHGTHVLTRQAFNTIGGFSEEFYGRAFSDDKMTFHGGNLIRRYKGTPDMPPQFSFAWTGRATFPTPPTKEKLLQVDPYANKHPITTQVGQIYLDHKFVEAHPGVANSMGNSYISKARRANPNYLFGTGSPTKRIL